MTQTEIAFSDVDGLRVAYRSAGSGPPLVLLHGFLFDSRSWEPQLEELAGEFTVIAWDAPGAGDSSDPPPDFKTADWIRCLWGLLAGLGIKSAHIVGLSWGGIIAQEFYRHHPSRTRSLVLADTYAGWKGSLPEEAWTERLESCLHDASLPPEEVVAKYLPGMYSNAASSDVRAGLRRVMVDFHPQGFRLMARSSAETDTRNLLPTIKVPTLLLWGESDVRSPLTVANEMHRAIPEAQLSLIPETGHLSNYESPDPFNEAIRSFLRAIPET